MAKIGHNAKAIGFAKWSVWLKNSKYQKHAKNVSRDTLELFWEGNGSKKTPNIWEITKFGKLLELATLKKLQALQNGQFG